VLRGTCKIGMEVYIIKKTPRSLPSIDIMLKLPIEIQKNILL